MKQVSHSSKCVCGDCPLVKREQELTRLAMQIVIKAYNQDDQETLTADDESGSAPTHPGLLLPEHPQAVEPVLEKNRVKPSRNFERMFQ